MSETNPKDSPMPPKRVNLKLREDLHWKLKEAAARARMTMQDYLEKLITDATDQGRKGGQTSSNLTPGLASLCADVGGNGYEA